MTDQIAPGRDRPYMTDEQVRERMLQLIVTRARFLATSAPVGVTASAVLAGCGSQPSPTPAPSTQPPTPAAVQPSGGAQSQAVASPVAGAQPAPMLGGFTYFNTFQAEVVNAAAGRIVPTDENGPGAIEAGVVYF